MTVNNNSDEKVINGFGREWRMFDQSQLGEKELYALFSAYFSIFPWDKVSKESIGFELVCGGKESWGVKSYHL